ncbi:hypothetical protein M2347_000485 [Chryseobacterium sp. H1D6B]|uniref:hypothetical protein n=1 Tax=Chryseobacterium sp. H1D6B TaxID=2940588 RepID=UPI0015CB2E07|nr:hypothetical protein [Chryseobacterium sp. H1D6B]MDH6250758.1 hypothetical protein [Chryseobacterium sp. H1D6B]
MKNRISYLFLTGLLVWSVIIIMRKNGIIIPFVNNHLTDLYTIPMYCYLIQFIMNGIMGFHWKPDLKFILISTLNLSLLFEGVLPLFSNRFTGDIYDVVAYGAGGMTYYFFNSKFFSFCN